MRKPIKLGIADTLLGIRCVLCKRRERGREKFQYHHLDGIKHNNAPWNIVLVHRVCHTSITKMNGQYVFSKRGGSQRSNSDTRPLIEGEREESMSPLPLNASPKVEETRTRSIEAKRGLLKYLWEEAIPNTLTKKEIIHNAPGWINRDDPISEACIRRWLDLFSLSVYYPFRFDKLDRIYLETVMPIDRKQEVEK